MNSELVTSPYRDGDPCDDCGERDATTVIWYRKHDGTVDDTKPPPVYLCDRCQEIRA